MTCCHSARRFGDARAVDEALQRPRGFGGLHRRRAGGEIAHIHAHGERVGQFPGKRRSIADIREDDGILLGKTTGAGTPDIAGCSQHQSHTARRPSCFLQNHRIGFRRGQNRPDNMPAVLHTGMDRPAGDRPHIGVAGISV